MSKAETQFYAAIRLLVGMFIFYFMACFFNARDIIEAASSEFSGVSHEAILLVAAAGFVSSACFALGIATRASAVALFISYQLAIHFFPPARQLHVAYLSMVLFIIALFHKSRSVVSFRDCELDDTLVWRTPLFLVIYLGFTLSGLSKLFLVNWFDGSAQRFMCPSSPIAYLLGQKLCAIAPHRAMGYSVLAIETFSFPLALIPRMRKWIWLLNTLLHAGALIFVNLPQVSAGVLLLQLFLFHREWWLTGQKRIIQEIR